MLPFHMHGFLFMQQCTSGLIYGGLYIWLISI